MTTTDNGMLEDTGERMIPPAPGEVSFVWERHRFAYSYAASMSRGKSVLDVGCGTGYGAHLLSETASSVLAIDNSPDAIQYCRQHFSAPNLEFRVVDGAHLDLGKQFDMILSFQVIEHLPDPEEFLRRMREHTRPGGIVLVTTPNVREPDPVSDNPFHMSEMNAAQMRDFALPVFDRFEVRGVGYAGQNRLRSIIQRTPLYKLGRQLKRSSALKKAADRAFDLRRFQVINDHVERDAIDLLLVAHVGQD